MTKKPIEYPKRDTCTCGHHWRQHHFKFMSNKPVECNVCMCPKFEDQNNED